MSRIRIVCKAEPLSPVDVPAASARLVRMNVIPDAHDTHVYLVDDEGTEHEVHGVTRITWSVACDDEAAKAVLEVDGVEVDVVGLQTSAKTRATCSEVHPGQDIYHPDGHPAIDKAPRGDAAIASDVAASQTNTGKQETSQ